jgi:hypothetical protein
VFELALAQLGRYLGGAPSPPPNTVRAVEGPFLTVKGDEGVEGVEGGSTTQRAAAAAAAAAPCDSRTVQGFAIKSILGGNGPTHDVASAAVCEQLCCAAAASSSCTGWSYTPVTRPGECAKHGCCFLKTAPPSSVNAHMAPIAHFTTGCIGFNCSRPSGQPRPSPSPPPPAPHPSPPPLPFPYTTPFFVPRRSIFANNSLDALRDPTTAIWSAERGGTWHVYSSSMVRTGPHCCGEHSGRPQLTQTLN